MNENEYNIENLLADEIHRLDLRIDDFTAMVTALNNRVSNLNNNDINENISNISNIVDRHTTQIESLQAATTDNQSDISKTQDSIDEVSGVVSKQSEQIQSLQDNHEVAKGDSMQKRGKSGDYDNDIAAIHEEINQIAGIVDNHTTQIDTLQSVTSDTQVDITKTQDYIDEVSGIVDKQGMDIQSLQDNEHVRESAVLTKSGTRGLGNGEYDDDIAELHEEIHEVAEIVDAHTVQINDLDSSLGILTANYENKCAELDAEDLSLQSQIIEMDEEHHEELHMLANAIDGCIVRIENAENTVNSYPKHVVMTMTEYESMISRDSNTFYYIKEE